MKKVILFKLISITIILTNLSMLLLSCTIKKEVPADSSTQKAPLTSETEILDPEKLYGRGLVLFEEKLVDIATIPKRPGIAPDYYFYPDTFESLKNELETFDDACVLIITVVDITKQIFDELYYSYVPIQVNEVLYRGENCIIEEKQQLKIITQMYAVNFSGEEKKPIAYKISKNVPGFFIGGEYMVFGRYNEETNVLTPFIEYYGVIEITDFSDQFGFKCDPVGFKEEAFKEYGIIPKASTADF